MFYPDFYLIQVRIQNSNPEEGFLRKIFGFDHADQKLIFLPGVDRSQVSLRYILLKQ